MDMTATTHLLEGEVGTHVTVHHQEGVRTAGADLQDRLHFGLLFTIMTAFYGVNKKKGAVD